jgi:CheY-like chemotaxis protein
MLTEAQFLVCVRTALNNLYEPDRLRRSPLASLFGVANRPNTFSALQRMLIEAIESLQPAADGLHHSFNWETYELLFYRYVQQLNQDQVARQLGMSVRHLRRKEGQAVEVLANTLWQRHCPTAEVREGAGSTQMPEVTPAAGPGVNEELAWLRTATLESPADVNQVLAEVVELIRPLTAQHTVRLDAAAPDLPALAVHPVALSQLLLNLLTVSISRAPGGDVTISARPLTFEVEILVRGHVPASALKPASTDDTASIDLARQLADLCGIQMTLSDDRGEFQARMLFPARERLPVLVIDDNADTLELLRRYAVDSRYALVTTQDAQEALRLAHECSPRIIVLDVMMPRTDGWKLLGRLREHPVTEHIPVIVCTILAQEELAFSLGASGFVRKPLSRQAFLAALDHQVILMATESR